ncbi:CotH kinase family protein [Streptomyces sp. AM 4-1-1]|uniref:CotH kinase family protein n=1 Tax=Streptomyces sp. AM 4-1-1 TaxID=3028710 RepID=UPI0023B96C37|nr:CotH kinase family protein [Streptomyces sp. AM 4-1-1]WEH36708.1 CotH kinase family protein [Streptomyces sp. AM 4-1-1]
MDAPGTTSPERPRGRRLRDRIPVRLRHHWKPPVALCAGMAVLLYFFGDARVAPFVTSSSAAEADRVVQDVRGTVGLYDPLATHSLRLTYRRTDFDSMMKEFKKHGTKDYIRADLTIDGTRLEDVGIRLKGNSTLMSLSGRMPGKWKGPGGGGLPGGPQNGRPGGGAPGAGAPGGGAPGGGQPGKGGTGGGMTFYDLSPNRPEELPWLIKIDEFIEGRAYQGHRQISLRPGVNDQVPLNEAVSLSLMASSGQTAEDFGFASVRVNDRPAVARLMVENPSKDFAESAVGGNGVLYKARAGGTFAYKGDDPTDYEASFNQLNKKGSQDLEPVMKLVKWANKATDKEFAQHLGDHVDIDSLARYVATQNLLMNFDDMAGPGKNYVLRYDLDSKKFRVLGWDFNLTFSGSVDTGPDDPVGMGMMPGMPGAGGQKDAAQKGTAQGDTGQKGTGQTGTAQKGAGGQPGAPGEGAPQPPGMPTGFPGGKDGDKKDGGMMARLMEGHVLKKRFLALDAFDAPYHAAYRELYEKFYGSGTALTALAANEGQARRAGADAKKLGAAAGKLRTTIVSRDKALAKRKEVTG